MTSVILVFTILGFNIDDNDNDDDNVDDPWHVQQRQGSKRTWRTQDRYKGPGTGSYFMVHAWPCSTAYGQIEWYCTLVFLLRTENNSIWRKLTVHCVKVLHGVMQQSIDKTGLEKTPVRSSGTCRFPPRASSVLPLLAPWARAQASRSPTKFLIMILRRKGKF